ncbi:MAG TPA: porin family protein [Ohtaekwangia sp.]
MKRLITLLVLPIVFCLIADDCMAQAQVALGLKGGLNFAKLDTDNFSTKNRTGYHLGAFATFKLTKIAIQPELIFSQQGSEVKDPTLGNVESNFSYINIPVMLKIYLIGGLNLQVGPQFGFLTSAELDGDDIKDDLKSSDLSVGLGAGIDLPFRLTADARYNLGISDVSDDSANEIKNQVWQISVGYKLFKFGN